MTYVTVSKKILPQGNGGGKRSILAAQRLADGGRDGDGEDAADEGGDQLGAQWILDLWYFAPYSSPSSLTLQPRLICGG